ncbi:MAG TPA: HAMP domain-containing sensor histidine kinase [Acidimicrobiia bacterium]
MRIRLAWLAMAVTTLVVIAYTVPLVVLVDRQAADRAKVRVENDAQSLATVVALAVATTPEVTPESIESATGGLGPGLGVVLSDGSVVGEADPTSPIVSGALAGSQAAGEVEGRWEVALPVGYPAGFIAAVASTPMADLSAGVTQATVVLVGLGLALIGAAVFVADRLGRSLTRPVSDLAATAHSLAEGNLQTRSEVNDPPELAEVGDALNELAGRLDHLIASEREMMADLSHRLRTPLTALRLQVEGIEDPAVRQPVVSQVERMETSVDRLIKEVRDGRRPPSQCDLVEAVGRRLQYWSLLAEAQGRSLVRVLAPGPLPVAASEDDIGAMLDALLGNVLSHTPPGTGLSLTVAAQPKQAALVVADEGQGFPSGFDPTERGASGAGSTGLGLDIARQVAEAAGGSLLLTTAPSGGAMVVASFPLKREPG